MKAKKMFKFVILLVTLSAVTSLPAFNWNILELSSQQPTSVTENYLHAGRVPNTSPGNIFVSMFKVTINGLVSLVKSLESFKLRYPNSLGLIVNHILRWFIR